MTYVSLGLQALTLATWRAAQLMSKERKMTVKIPIGFKNPDLVEVIPTDC